MMRALPPKQPQLTAVRPLQLGQTPLQQRSKPYGIKASLLIPGRGDPVEDGAVVIDDDKIAWAGSQSSIPSEYKSINYTRVPIVMPGMWDCHVHYFGTSINEAAEGAYLLPAALIGARVAVDLQRTLLAGFTTVREVGGHGGDVSQAVAEGTIIGPNIYSSVAPISMSAGHGDLHSLPISTIVDASSHGLPFALCDGVPECIKTVRLMIRRGAKLIKICGTGGVGSLLDDPEDRQFSDEEIKAMVDEAGRAKRIVAAHCHGKDGIIACVKAGVKTIEHGSYLDEEVAALMKEKDAIFIATRLIVEAGLDQKQLWSPISYKKLVAIAEAGRKAYALAIKSGVKIALGTDQTISTPGIPMSHGLNGKELFYAVESGMTPLQAIEACTATSPETLGAHMAPKSGQLKEGYDADIIALAKNPLDDVLVLSKPDNVTHVWKGGKLYKSP